MNDSESTHKVRVKKPANPDADKFWVSYAQMLVNDSLGKLDDRAKFMITTVAALMTVNFGVLHFATKSVAAISVTPQMFLAASAVFFVFSLFPKEYEINPWTPDDTETKYGSIVRRKHRWHSWGFALLLIGLAAMVVTMLLSP